LKSEGIPVSANMFADITCDAPMKEGFIEILSGACPGLSRNKPMALVVHGFKRLRSKHAREYHSSWPGWLSLVLGEILYSDGVSVTVRVNSSSFIGYNATKSDGNTGFIYAGHCEVL